MSEFLERVSNWPANRWLMGGGMAMMFLSFVSGVANVEIVSEMRYLAFGGGLILTLLGAWYAREAKRFEAMERMNRRVSNRKVMPLSPKTSEFTHLITDSMTQEQIANLPFAEDDKLKVAEARMKLKVSRAREAAQQGERLYYSEGLFIPRNDATVIQ